MGLFDKVAEWLIPGVPVPPVAAQAALPSAAAAPAVPTVPPVPAQLPKIAAKTAAEICKTYDVEPAAKKLLTPQQTPVQFLSVLQENHLGADMVKVLAYGMPEREGVAWAVRCAQKVAGKLPPADVQAMQAAQAWVENPTPEARKAAAAAAERTDFQGPGAWAAQAVAWTGDGAPGSNVPDGAAGPPLPPQAVSASVLLASSLFARPEFAFRKLSAFQMPAMNVPSVSGALQANLPQVSGAVGQLQAGIGSAQSLSAMAASGQLPAAMAAAAAAKLGLPSVGGAVSLPAVSGALPQMAVPGMAGMASALGSGPVLPSGSLPGMAGLPGMASPSISGQLPTIAQPNIPQFRVPDVPPAVLAFVFGEQQAFIGIGLDMASGKIPAA